MHVINENKLILHTVSLEGGDKNRRNGKGEEEKRRGKHWSLPAWRYGSEINYEYEGKLKLMKIEYNSASDGKEIYPCLHTDFYYFYFLFSFFFGQRNSRNYI